MLNQLARAVGRRVRGSGHPTGDLAALLDQAITRLGAGLAV
jgi:hypothetical protein